MQPSPAQIAANIANAQKSTGPKTQAGKNRSRLNAYRHGITGQILIFTAEDQQAFDKHCDGIRQSFEPIGPTELHLAQSIAEDYWRLQRARALENGIFALGHGSDSPSAIPNSSDLPSEAEVEASTGQQQ